MEIVLFEDEKYQNLLPLVYFRPVWELRCGVYLLGEKIQNFFSNHTVKFMARKYLEDYYLKQQNVEISSEKQDLLLLNGRILMREGDREKLDQLEPNTAFIQGDELVAVRIRNYLIKKFLTNGLVDINKIVKQVKCSEIDITLISYPWDLIDNNGNQLREEFNSASNGGRIDGVVETGVHMIDHKNIYVAKDARILPGVVLDAEDGPIWIDKGAKVMSNAVLQGPIYVGPASLIKIGAKIYENTSIGPVCKVGGEVEETVIKGYSNKQHDGFLGHSYLGEWINIGADTNNSDLKNNYGEISVFLNNHNIKTGKHFLGLIMGDHSKTAINTMFNTGTVVGVSSNIFGAGFPPKFVPSFSWGGSSGLREYNFDKALEVAEIVMRRRNVSFTENEKHLFKQVKELSLQVENRVRLE